MSDELISQIDDRLEKRFESYAQAQLEIHKEYHEELMEAVKTEIKQTVNGKIDKIQTQMNAQDKTLEEVKSLLEERKFVAQLWSFLKLVGGTIVSIGSAIILYNNVTK